MRKKTRFFSALIGIAMLAACSFPSWLTYTNHAYSFKLQYPPAGSIDPGATDTAIRIELPFTPGTNLVEKYVNINVQTSVSTCESPNAAGYAPGTLTPTTLVINGLTWVKESAGEGAAGSRYDWTAYSTVNGIVCVSLTFILHSHPPELYPTPPPAFNQSAELAIFILVVATFRWLRGGATTPTPGLALLPLSLPVTFTPPPTDTSVPTAVDTSTPQPTTAFAATSTLTPTPVSLAFIPKADPQRFNYLRDCKPVNPQVDISATVSGSPNLDSVMLFFRLKNKATNAETPWNTGVVMNNKGNGMYDFILMWNQIPNLSAISQTGASAWLEYQFVATDSQNNVLGRSPVYSDVSLTPCK